MSYCGNIVTSIILLFIRFCYTYLEIAHTDSNDTAVFYKDFDAFIELTYIFFVSIIQMFIENDFLNKIENVLQTICVLDE